MGAFIILDIYKCEQLRIDGLYFSLIDHDFYKLYIFVLNI